MVSVTIEREYRALRQKGWRATEALRDARVKADWRTLNGVEVGEYDADYESADALVRIMIMADDTPEFALDFDCSDHGQCDWKHGYPCKAHKQEIERANRDGVVGIVGQYRDSRSGEWSDSVDSVWGFIGDDWRESGYDTDVMIATMEALQHFTGC